MKVVLDTNVWVSALLAPRSNPGRLLMMTRLGLLHVVSSRVLWEELYRAVGYTRVRTPLERDGLWETTRRFLHGHPMVAFVPAVDPEEPWMPRDEADNWVIQCALTANADLVITGDKELLRLGRIRDVRLLSPREALAELAAAGIVVW